MVTIRYRELQNFSFASIFQVVISGSSQTGKTHFAELLLKRNLFRCDRCYYFHPDCHETQPVEWKLNFPIIFDAEFPTVDTFMKMPEYSCIILDDLVEECYKSSVIDYLYRVLSSKRKLHVILMSQRYYHSGRYAVSIRNSSNFHVLMRCVNKSMMNRISIDLGLKPEITKAIDLTSAELYPYIFIDRTPIARANKCEVFIDVLSKTFRLIRGSMNYYLLSESDFKKCFTIIDSEIAKYENKTKTTPNTSTTALVGSEENYKEEGLDSSPRRVSTPSKHNTDDNAIWSSTAEGDNSSDGGGGNSARDPIKPGKRRIGKWQKQKAFERKVKRVIHKYKIRS